MNHMRTVIIDAGHGGSDPGAVYNGRQEKDDALQLAFDLGSALERRGIRAEFTRVTDDYDSPQEKADIANRSDADFFCLHTPECHAGAKYGVRSGKPRVFR